MKTHEERAALADWERTRGLPEAARLREAAQRWPSGRESEDRTLLMAARAFARAADLVPAPMRLSARVERVLKPVAARCSRKVMTALRFELSRLEGFELLFEEMAKQRDAAVKKAGTR